MCGRIPTINFEPLLHAGDRLVGQRHVVVLLNLNHCHPVPPVAPVPGHCHLLLAALLGRRSGQIPSPEVAGAAGRIVTVCTAVLVAVHGCTRAHWSSQTTPWVFCLRYHQGLSQKRNAPNKGISCALKSELVG